jgi:hypothetical protein
MFDYNCDTCTILVLSSEIEHPCAAGKLQRKAWRTKHSNMYLQAYILITAKSIAPSPVIR